MAQETKHPAAPSRCLHSRPTDLPANSRCSSKELAGDLQIKLDGPIEQQVQQALQELDVTDFNSIIFFGSKAQQQLTTISDTMLENVRTKDVGQAGNALNVMVAKLREIDIGEIDPTDRPGFFGRLFGIKSEVQKYLDKYEDVRSQMTASRRELEQHKTKMLTDIVKLDKLYDANLDYFRTPRGLHCGRPRQAKGT